MIKPSLVYNSTQSLAPIGDSPGDKIVETGIDIVDEVTSVPRYLDRASDELNDYFIRLAKKFKSGAAEKVEENLTENKISSIWKDFGRWVRTGQNWAYVAGSLVLFFIIARKV